MYTGHNFYFVKGRVDWVRAAAAVIYIDYRYPKLVGRKGIYERWYS